ncbi:MAG: hypothetical protein AB8B91_23140 [Rubripirellula sp.]
MPPSGSVKIRCAGKTLLKSTTMAGRSN